MTISTKPSLRSTAAPHDSGDDPMPGPAASDFGFKVARGTDGPDRLVGAPGEWNALFGTGPFTGAGSELRFEEIRGNTLVFADVDGDRTADFALRLNGSIALSADDFVL